MLPSVRTLLRFSRPHTILATGLQVLLGLAFTFNSVPVLQPASVVLHLALMIVAGLGLNIYVVGINQITDIEIDRINKPDLPLAAGDMSQSQARAIVTAGAATALLSGLVLGWYWFIGNALILVLGTLYSCQPLRLKQYAVWSGLVIALCRGVIFNLTTFATWHHLYRVTITSWAPIGALSVFMFAFVLAIGIFKDLPDTEGDRKHLMLTYAVKYGTSRSYWGGVVLLSCAYAAVISANLLQIGMERNLVFLAAMILSLVSLAIVAARIRDLSQRNLTGFYRIIWILFYVGLVSFSAYALLSGRAAGVEPITVDMR
jgi:homogentisate phytyltransferase/homogentisate geranylgeranyltransferase